MISKWWQLVPVVLFLAMIQAATSFLDADWKVSAFGAASYILGSIYTNLVWMSRKGAM